MKIPETNSSDWFNPNDLQNEVWLEVLENKKMFKRFAVSNYGRVKVWTWCDQRWSGSILRLQEKDDGRFFIKVANERVLIHRLVANAFIPNPERLPFIDHINGDYHDNRVSNLRWVTQKTNSQNPISRLRGRLNKEGDVLRFVPPLRKNHPREVSEVVFGDSHGIRLADVLNLLKTSLYELRINDLEVENKIKNFTSFSIFFQKCKKFVPPGEQLYYLCGGISNKTLMTFAFYLKDKNKKQGTPLILIVSHHGKKFKKSTGIIVKPEFFKKQRVKDEAVNEKLRKIEITLTEKLNQFSTDEEVTKTLEYAIWMATGRMVKWSDEDDGRRVPTFYEYFDEWANRDTPQKRQRRNTLKLIRECMGDSWDWADIDTAFFFRLVQKLKAREYSVNYIGSIAKKLKTVMSEGYKLKYHTNTDYRQFSAPMEEASTVYLTREEVDRLWNLGLSDDTERRCRDLFLLGCYTAMRFSDYSRLSLDNIRDGMIYFTQKKTAGRVVVPASPRVLAILKRNGGEAPKVGQEVLNRTIKVVCFKARIFDKVEVTKSKGGRHETRLVEKYTQVSSHTARRTAATLLYQSGVPASAVMQLTGHKTETDFYRYIRTTREENARMLADNPFFK